MDSTCSRGVHDQGLIGFKLPQPSLECKSHACKCAWQNHRQLVTRGSQPSAELIRVRGNQDFLIFPRYLFVDAWKYRKCVLLLCGVWFDGD